MPTKTRPFAENFSRISTSWFLARSLLSKLSGATTTKTQGVKSMISTRNRYLLGALLTATVLGAGAAVHSQPGPSIWDSSQLPETRGTVKLYTLTPRGDIDGLILDD